MGPKPTVVGVRPPFAGELGAFSERADVALESVGAFEPWCADMVSKGLAVCEALGVAWSAGPPRKDEEGARESESPASLDGWGC